MFVWIVDEDVNALVDAVAVEFWLIVRLLLHLNRQWPRRKRCWFWELVGQEQVSWGIWTIPDMRSTWCHLAIILHSLLSCPVLPAALSRHAALWSLSAISSRRWLSTQPLAPLLSEAIWLKFACIIICEYQISVLLITGLFESHFVINKLPFGSVGVMTNYKQDKNFWRLDGQYWNLLNALDKY